MPLRFIPLLVTLFLGPAESLAERRVTPFELRPPGDIVVPVSIDGQGPFQMLLDTGASRSSVRAAVARRLASRVVGGTTMLTPAGGAHRSLVLLKGVSIAGRSASVVGMQLDDDDLAQGIDGLIGQDVLATRVYTIDYTSASIIWHSQLESGAAGTRLHVDLENGRMLVSLPQRAARAASAPAGGTVLRMIPDSGADRLVLFTRAELPSLVAVDAGVLRSVNGTRAARQVRVEGLDVGEIRLEDQDAALLERTVGDRPFGDGLLPLHLFARVTINGPDRYLIVQR